MSSPVKLSSVAGTALTNAEIADWLVSWADHFRSSATPIKQIVLVAESGEGDIAIVCGGRAIDNARLTGILHIATSRVMASSKEGFLSGDHQ